jgi:hypothetical protein
MVKKPAGHWMLLATCALLGASLAEAREPQARGEIRFVGELSLMPAKGVGLWRIASRQVITDPMTEIIAMRGPMVIGACVQVDMRHDKVLKIETLRQDEC